ncbi:MAG: type II secretion system protein [Bdellovibrionales bacterium]|nr:type II secretion system protein [Bdellovibrionales bacterium]
MATTHNENGFGLIELLVVLIITALLAVVAVPDLFMMLSSHRRAFARTQFEQDLNRAIINATKYGARAILTPVNSGAGYEVGIDRAPFSASGTADATIFSGEFPSGVTFSSLDTLIVDPRGFVIDTLGNLNTVTYSLQHNGDAFLEVKVYAPGNIEFS